MDDCRTHTASALRVRLSKLHEPGATRRRETSLNDVWSRPIWYARLIASVAESVSRNIAALRDVIVTTQPPDGAPRTTRLPLLLEREVNGVILHTIDVVGRDEQMTATTMPSLDLYVPEPEQSVGLLVGHVSGGARARSPHAEDG
jgi:hypothetical protein